MVSGRRVCAQSQPTRGAAHLVGVEGGVRRDQQVGTGRLRLQQRGRDLGLVRERIQRRARNSTIGERLVRCARASNELLPPTINC